MLSEKNQEVMDLSSQFKILFKHLTQEWNRRSIDNLTYPQFRMLLYLWNHGPQRVSQLAEALCITPGAVTGGADRLLQDDYIERTRDEEDRRAVYIQLSDKGRTTIERIIHAEQEAMQSVFHMLPQEDIKQLRRILTVVLMKIDQQNNDKEV